MRIYDLPAEYACPECHCRMWATLTDDLNGYKIEHGTFPGSVCSQQGQFVIVPISEARQL